MTTRAFEILVVEDNPADVELIRTSLADTAFIKNFRVARDADEALDFLLHAEEDEDNDSPDLIFLDWNLPGQDGRELLAEIKAHPLLRRIPVIVLSSSDAEPDVRRAYDLYANAYVVKAVDFNQFRDNLQTTEAFWLDVARRAAVL